MNTVMKFENTNVSIATTENDVLLFDVYSTGMALGYVTVSKGISYPRKQRIDKTLENADIKPVVHGVQRFITENQLYDFMLEARTEKCRAFRKWVTNDVLPAIRKTGKYETPQAEQLTLETEEYHYYDKTYCGEPVLTLKDIEYFTGINFDVSSAYFNRHGVRGEDFAVLSGDSLRALKSENPSMPRGLRWLTVVTKSGFVKLMEFYGCKADTPKCFIADNKPVTAEKPKQAAAVHEFSKPTIDELVIALNVIQYARHNSEKCEKIANMSSMGEHYAKEQAGLDTARKYIGMMLTL